MSAPEEIEASELSEFQQTLCKISPVITNSFPFTDPKTKLQSTKRTRHFEVYYPKQGQKLTFSLQNVRTGNGIITTKWGKLFMSVNLTEEQAQLVRNTVDAAILEQIFQNRAKIFEGGREATAKLAQELQFSYDGIVQDGQAKDEKPDEKWPDQISGTVPSKKRDGALKPMGVEIVDADGKPYDWQMVSGRMNIKEVVVQVDKCSIDKKVKPNLLFRIIAVEDTAAPKITTKRLNLTGKSKPVHSASGAVSQAPTHNEADATDQGKKKPKKSKLNLGGEGNADAD